MSSGKLPLVVSIFLSFVVLSFSPATLAQMPALSPLPGTGSLSTPSNPAHFVFVAAGDNRPAKKGDPQGATPREIFAAAQKLNPAFLMWTGDTISGKDPSNPSGVQAEYSEFLGIAKTAGAPVFNAPGNHELDDKNDVPNAQMLSYYKADMGLPYGAFTYGNSRFITLDSEEESPNGTTGTCKADKGTDEDTGGKAKGSALGSAFLDPAPKTKAAKAAKPEAPGYIDDEQLALLKQDLDSNKDKAHVFIFMHHPVEALKCKDALDEKSVKHLKKLFKDYSNVSYVISGHEHIYYNPQSKSGLKPPPGRTDPAQPPTYLVSGGAGAPLSKGPNGFHHYMVFTVDGAKISVELIKLD